MAKELKRPLYSTQSGDRWPIDTKVVGKRLEIIWKDAHPDNFSPWGWDGKFAQDIVINNKISLCTTVMDRIENAKTSITQNIKDNIRYPNIEFVLLDYNSKDGFDKWVKENLSDYIKDEVVSFYRTEEPQYYDMSHSRNVAFKLADGAIVNNIDADVLTNEGFAHHINKLAHEQARKAIFLKSRQLLRGRLGFWKDEFISLGGYDERLVQYGHEDADLMYRALSLGFKMMTYKSKFHKHLPNHKKHQEGNYEKPWHVTEGRNEVISYANLIAGVYIANENCHWGKATVIKNFEEEITV